MTDNRDPLLVNDDDIAAGFRWIGYPIDVEVMLWTRPERMMWQTDDVSRGADGVVTNVHAHRCCDGAAARFRLYPGHTGLFIGRLSPGESAEQWLTSTGQNATGNRLGFLIPLANVEAAVADLWDLWPDAQRLIHGPADDELVRQRMRRLLVIDHANRVRDMILGRPPPVGMRRSPEHNAALAKGIDPGDYNGPGGGGGYDV